MATQKARIPPRPERRGILREKWMNIREKLQGWSHRHGIGATALAELVLIVCGQPMPVSSAMTGDTARLAVDQSGGMLLRNNSGVDRSAARPVRYGLGNDSERINRVFKAPDYVGIAPGGRFLGVEWKPPGWRYSPGDPHVAAQAAFLRRVNDLGGVGTFATCVADVARAINEG